MEQIPLSRRYLESLCFQGLNFLSVWAPPA